MLGCSRIETRALHVYIIDPNFPTFGLFLDRLAEVRQKLDYLIRGSHDW
jgi:hypothetical protein